MSASSIAAPTEAERATSCPRSGTVVRSSSATQVVKDSRPPTASTSEQMIRYSSPEGGHHMRPEVSAVPASAPALVDVATELRGASQLPLRMVGSGLLTRGQYRDVLTDDLLGPVAQDVFDRLIPPLHAASRVEHDDRVLPQARSQHAQPRLGLGLQPRDARVTSHGATGPGVRLFLRHASMKAGFQPIRS